MIKKIVPSFLNIKNNDILNNCCVKRGLKTGLGLYRHKTFLKNIHKYALITLKDTCMYINVCISMYVH